MAGLRVPLSTLHPSCYHDRHIDSGSGRVASPFTYGSFIRYSLPVLTGASLSSVFCLPTSSFPSPCGRARLIYTVLIIN